ncbi:YqcI/YcgG family protein [Nocardiopsis sp. NPDC007018]|uniref:YqcI/YcgG family protein n=1 Tax=Nocardiopsis sp. NPDC007018 TaxID=3155721 RepID=UPI003404C3DC
MLRTDSPFPCVFGSDAVRSGTLRYAFVPVGEGRVEALADALRVYTGIAESLGNRTSLVCFFEHDPRISTLDACEEHFWDLLRGLREQDECPWPEGISSDTEAADWEFAFNSTPMFVVANTPFHYKRRSRFFEYFAVTFQPRFVFDGLAAGTRTGDNARKIIRRRLSEYDSVAQTPLLGSFGEHGNKEWHQYFLDEENEVPLPTDRCPLHRSAATVSL